MDKYENIIGKILDGRYKILEPVGVGGMAFVLKAEDLVMNRVVAVKILNEQYNGDEEAEKRFINESKAVAMLSNQNIVSVYDVAIYPDIKYIVMEYLDGITLRTYMDNKKVLPWKEACVYTLQILRALEHAHGKNVIHRDIKPQNIMLMKDGCVKVTDFGIAKTPDMSDASSDEKAIGTVYYISPEQASGQETTYASDLYSVGVLFYEMLTGKLPFTADSAVTIAMMQINDTPKDIEEINPSVPYGVAQIVRKAMQKQPEKRFADAHAMLKAVDYVIKHPDVVFYEDDEPHDPEDSDSVNIGMINTGEIGDYVIKLEEEKKPEETVSKREQRKKDRKRERKEHPSHSIFPVITGVFLAFLIVALALGGYLAVKWLPTLFANEEVEDFDVRNITDMVYDTELRLELEQSNYIITVKESYVPGAKFNVILKQDPAPGKKRFSDGKCKMTIWVNKYPEDLTVPDVRYMSLSDAEMVFRNLRIATKINRVADKYANENQVVSTNPPIGSYITLETTVTLNVCDFGEEKSMADQVPRVIGLPVDDAIKALEYSYFLVNVEQRESDLPEGTVLAQSPEPGIGGLDAWTTVTITVSHYVESKIVEDYLGKTLQEAQSMIEYAGLVRGSVTYEASLLYPRGAVIRQSVAAGTAVMPGTVIDLVVSGEGKVYAKAVPDVRNKTLDEAKTALEEAGYNVTVIRRVTDVAAPGVIVAQSLPSGAGGYEVGTSITITVSVSSNSVQLVNFKGYTFAQLLKALRENGLTLGSVSFSEDYYGFNQFDVVAQGTPEGEYVTAGAPIDVVLYGSERNADPVPNVVGMQESEAIAALESAWYFVKTEKVVAVGSSGEVLSQSIDDSTDHPAGTTVTIQICIEQTYAVVPDLTGKTLDEVMDILDEAHLALGEISYESSDAPDGTVIAQTPSANSHAEFDSEVEIVLSDNSQG
ncbi:MAG: Stk1 family PASTA domain-containing Ser/Thr kinase [Clostridia bacterium]|nr:Stk1 family PASTA domain-containing Ser/Thr kinase [Clostridia bacterium]